MNENEYNRALEKFKRLERFIEEFDNKKEQLKVFIEHEKKQIEKRKKQDKEEILNEKSELNIKIAENESIKTDIKQLKKEYSIGFPLLAKALNEYFEILDKKTREYLNTKPHPAKKAAELVRLSNQKKREAVENMKKYEYILKYYETYFPFLLEVKGELLDEISASEILREYSDEEKEDRVTWYVTKPEYRKLTTIEKNQLALDRYWERRKSNKGIGNLYERYVGYLFECKGYDVTYTGILRSFEDLGRDLIAKKNKEIAIIQCKYWSEFKKIYENHIFQFFGTVYRYKFDYPKNNVKAIFYTKTRLSPLAKTFAKELKIKLVENFQLERYPCIKCNISRKTKEKIYHLPFDQQYDTAKVEKNRGEFYALTVKEAEDKGFRRAWKWKGNK